ncbi:MAG: hypothetical protein U0R49_01010 [Fimbriimonadales bacterium]
MQWLQTLPSFAIWIAFIWWRRNWLIVLPKRFESRSRRLRVGLMLLSLLGSLTVLFIGLWAVEKLNLMPDGHLEPLGYVAVTALGLVFLVGQMLAFALTVSLARIEVTGARTQLSNPGTTQLSHGEKE